MSRKSVAVMGICKLCLKRRKLRKSHLLGRAFYKMCKGVGSDPIVMTPQIILPTSRQVSDYVLCETCEQLFNSNGENYVSTLVYDGTGFPLLDKMNVALTVKEEPNLLVYSASAMGLDVDKIAYFALSVFWRASVHSWATIGAQRTSVSLGAHEEPIRKFLVGKAPFPVDIAVVVHACSDHGSKGLIFFPTAAIGSTYATYSVLVRGLYFRVLTGLSPSAHGRRLCIVNSPRHVIFEEDCNKRTLHAYGHLRKTAKVAKPLQ
jgi:hypothetical protein